MKRLFKSDLVNGKHTRVYGKNEHGEYIVRFYINGILMDASDYFTDDLDDAIGTAKAIMNEEAMYESNIVSNAIHHNGYSVTVDGNAYNLHNEEGELVVQNPDIEAFYKACKEFLNEYTEGEYNVA